MYRLPKGYRWALLDAAELDHDNEGVRVVSESAIRRARESTDALRIVFFGNAGAGKTSLAIAVGRAAMARRDVNGMFCTALELDRWRAEARRGQGDAEDVQRAIDVPVLVLDELAAEDGKDSTVAEVIHQRHAAMRQTIVTSAVGAKALADHYTDGIARRLFEGAVRIDCEAERQPKPSAAPVLRLPPRAPLAGLPGPRGVPADLAGATPWARPAAAPQRATAGGSEGGAVPCPPELRERLLADLERIGQGPGVDP